MVASRHSSTKTKAGRWEWKGDQLRRARLRPRV
jgi:hypothetical protein